MQCNAQDGEGNVKGNISVRHSNGGVQIHNYTADYFKGYVTLNKYLDI